MLRLGASLMLLATAASAQPVGHTYEGYWIWDPTQSTLPSNLGEGPPIVGDVMQIAHDDGSRFAARFDEYFANNTEAAMIVDVPEDGTEHVVNDGRNPPTMASVSILPDGGLHIMFRSGSEANDSGCKLWDNGNKLTCAGTHVSNGTTAPFICFYRRDPHVIRVAP
ncbi:MAG TPA: hypothetical protein VMB71_10680 [Acetobacteraceae bacterium]|nr:hypothetical protein [Acetobacteraceae bacterium]